MWSTFTQHVPVKRHPDVVRHRKNISKDLLLPVGGKNTARLVVASKVMDTALDENEPELGILILKHVTTPESKQDIVHPGTFTKSHIIVFQRDAWSDRTDWSQQDITTLDIQITLKKSELKWKCIQCSGTS